MLKILTLFAFIASSMFGANLQIAAGGGYKKPMMKILKQYQKEHEKVDIFFGNMRQVSSQAKQNNVSFIVGDKNFLSNKSNINFTSYEKLGEGKMVLAYRKNIKLKNLNDLKNKKIKKVAIPHPKKAIYGTAGKEVLIKSNLYPQIKDKLYILATIPQVSSYLIAGEIDAGFINITAALANKNKLGGYLPIDTKYYKKIDIVAAITKNCKDKKCKELLLFLKNDFSKSVFKKYGM